MKSCMNKHSIKGFTLIELILAMALFIALMGGLAFAIMRGIRVHDFESVTREAQRSTRNVLNQMVEELRCAVPLSTMENARYNIASGVWYPDCYGSEDSGEMLGGGGFYKCGLYEDTGVDASGSVHVAFNRLIFTRAANSPTEGNMDANHNIQGYVFVDWFVPKDAPNRIYRVVHRVNVNYKPYSFRAIPGTSTSGWVLNDNAKTFFGDGNNLGTNLVYNGTDRDTQFTVAQLPSVNDSFCFGVKHKNYRDKYNANRKYDVTNGAYYDTDLFEITVKAVVYRRGEEVKKEEQLDQDPYFEGNKSNAKGVFSFTEQVRTSATDR